MRILAHSHLIQPVLGGVKINHFEIEELRKVKLLNRFEANTAKPADPAGCWTWTGPRTPAGYGIMRIQRKSSARTASISISAHRYSFLIHNGSIEDDKLVCHRCDNPPCVNPAHLFSGTTSDNLRDSANKGRNYNQTNPPRGTLNGRSIINEDDVKAIRVLAQRGMPHREIAPIFRITPATVSAIVTRRNWGWIT